MPKVGVCIPHGGLVDPLLYRHILQLQEKLGEGYSFVYTEVEMASLAKARNMMVEASLEHGCDYILFVDDDVILPDNADLLFSYDADIVSGLYIARQPPHTPQVYIKASNPEHGGKYWPYVSYPRNELFECDAVGAGCLLVKAAVFRKLRERWEDMRVNALEAAVKLNGSDTDLKAVAHLGAQLSPWFEFLDARGEDFYFCERAREAGYRILADSRVKCQHAGRILLTEDHFLDAQERGFVSLSPEAMADLEGR